MIGSSRARVARAGGTPHITLPGYATLVPLLVSTRPEQWSKNLFVFAALLFGNRLLQPDAVVMAFATFAIFCGLSAAVYLLNDIADRALIVHAAPDDYASQPAGNAGARVACGVIKAG